MISKRRTWVEWQTLLAEAFDVWKNHTKTQMKVDKTKGRMLDFGSLVETFGISYNRERTIRLGAIHAAKCVMLKDGYTGKDRIAGCTTFLKLAEEREETFVEAWKTFEKTKELEPPTPASTDDTGNGTKKPDLNNTAAGEAAAARLVEKRKANKELGAQESSASGAGKDHQSKSKVKDRQGSQSGGGTDREGHYWKAHSHDGTEFGRRVRTPGEGEEAEGEAESRREQVHPD